MTSKMNKAEKARVKMAFFYSIMLLIMVIPSFIVGFIEGSVLLSIILACMFLYSGIQLFRFSYLRFLELNRKSRRWCKSLSKEELEMVEDAKELIKKVDNSITISEFNVYKVRFITKGWFYYDKDTSELNIFIPFKFLLWVGGEDFCFLVLVHEILHSQNLKNNLRIFKRDFLEGLNQLLTEWLIDNYSEKYNKRKPAWKSIKIKLREKLTIHLEILSCEIYKNEVNIAKEIIEKFHVDLRQVFLNYIDFNPNFFKRFVPSEYLTEQ